MHTLTSQDRRQKAQAEPSAEQSLLACIREQSTVFTAAVVLIEQLETAATTRNLGDPDSVVQLQQTLERIVTAQQKVAKAHERFIALKITTSTALRNALAQHEDTLKKLVTRIDSLQHVFETIRNKLSPELDADIRRRSMHSAYQKSLKSV